MTSRKKRVAARAAGLAATFVWDTVKAEGRAEVQARTVRVQGRAVPDVAFTARYGKDVLTLGDGTVALSPPATLQGTLKGGRAAESGSSGPGGSDLRSRRRCSPPASTLADG